MELFLEFVFSIALSLLLAFFIAKILSGSYSSTCSDDHHASVVTGERKFEAKSETNGSGGQKRTGFVEEIMKVGDLGDSRQEKSVLEEILNDGLGSCNDVEIDENKLLREVEVVGLVEKLIEETADKSDGVCECEENLVVQSIESEKVAKFEIDLSKEVVLESENKNEEDDGKGDVFECEEISVDKTDESGKYAKIETEISKHQVVAESGEIEILGCKYDNEIGEANKKEDSGVMEVLFDEDDDWEGVERTELERIFGAAVAFVGIKSNADRVSCLGSNVIKQLYGLHKIATEGPCHEPQPMALKVSARANWNAWKELGKMAPEVAMEQYVTILLRSIPGCIQDDVGGDSKQNFADANAYNKLASDLKTWQRDQLGAVDERNIDKLMPRLDSFDMTSS